MGREPEIRLCMGDDFGCEFKNAVKKWEENFWGSQTSIGVILTYF